MKKLLDIMAMSVGGWIGWTLGAPVSIFTAYLVSAVGAGVGLYAGRRLSKRLLP